MDLLWAVHWNVKTLQMGSYFHMTGLEKINERLPDVIPYGMSLHVSPKTFNKHLILPFTSTWVHPRFVGGFRVPHLFSFFVLSYYGSLRSEFHVVMSVTISAYKRCSVHFYLQLFVWGLMSYLGYLCLFAHSGVQHIVLCFCAVFLRLVYPCC